MNKAELEKKPLSELYSLAAEAGVERYRMLPRDELIAKLAGGGGGGGGGSSESASEQRERPPRRRRRSSGRGESGGERRSQPQARKPKPKPEPEPSPAAAPSAGSPQPAPKTGSSRPRRRRRRRFGRRGKQGVSLQGLLLPPAGRQALLAAENREGCTTLLRGIAAELSDAKGPDPVVLLIDPSPEELADWRRDAPRAEIVAAGQPRHADDALAQAQTRASGGEDVILLIDSLTRLGEAHGDADADAAKQFFDAAGGSLTVVAALERH